MARRPQPHWEASGASDAPVLKLYNSFTRDKEVFHPKQGKKVFWYSCGPTVYDAAHMGHARSYISFDILRRVLSNYFGYDVLYVMNITDIDDKIIKRARQLYLLKEYKSLNKTLEEVLVDTKSSLDLLLDKAKEATDRDVKEMLKRQIDSVMSSVEKVVSAVETDDGQIIEKAKQNLLEEASGPLSDWLDKKLGSTVSDNSIFADLPKHWEEEFHKDMDALNVLRPNVLTRVSEYVPEIVEYIQRIIGNGLAYQANGSIYFDVKAFDSMENHHYAKLVPEAYGDAASLQSGEGDLVGDAGEKKSPTDFALWKASKPGEPWWDSPWGKGRPGWHIECSVMASAICGDSLDIHTGGVDLKFPHHDNELAQAEAYFNNDCWVRYFLHSGHLTISGCKMSKSLKNFISINDALKKHSARQLRIAFLLHSWKDTLDYSENTMDMAKSYEKMLNEFFLNMKDLTLSVTGSTVVDSFLKWSSRELELNAKFYRTKNSVHAALCDNVDTRTALDSIRECVTACNLYARSSDVNSILLRDISLYITHIMSVFGVINRSSDIGFPLSSDHENIEQKIMPYLKVLGTFRDEIRAQAREVKSHKILELCDKLRDDILPEVGVRLEDREGKPSVVKICDQETLMREKQERLNADEEKLRKKREMEASRLEKEALKRIPPQQMFLSMKDKYSAFDENGVPTHDAEGKELSKGPIKKLQKLWQQQQAKYLEHVNSAKSS